MLKVLPYFIIFFSLFLHRLQAVLCVTNTITSLLVFARFLDAHNHGVNPLYKLNTDTLELPLL